MDKQVESRSVIAKAGSALMYVPNFIGGVVLEVADFIVDHVSDNEQLAENLRRNMPAHNANVGAQALQSALSLERKLVHLAHDEAESLQKDVKVLRAIGHNMITRALHKADADPAVTEDVKRDVADIAMAHATNPHKTGVPSLIAHRAEEVMHKFASPKNDQQLPGHSVR